MVYYPPDEARKALLSTVFAGQHVEPEFKEMHQMISHISALLAPKRAQEFRDQNTAGILLQFATLRCKLSTLPVMAPDR